MNGLRKCDIQQSLDGKLLTLPESWSPTILKKEKIEVPGGYVRGPIVSE
jgi:hypothetical protein